MERLNYNDTLAKYLDRYQEELLHDLCEFIKIESVSDDPEKVSEALEYVLSLARSFGFETKSLLSGRVGVVEMGRGTEVLGILSHVDVVGPGDLDQWQSSPFDPVIRDNKIFGRGTLDDKGPIIACLYGMKAVCDLGVPLKKRVQLILGTQEEVEWTDMEAYVKEYPLPDYGFTPDGEFPLCNIEKGVLDITLLFPFDLPENDWKNGKSLTHGKDGKYLTHIEAGTAVNVVPGTCIAEITQYRNGKSEQTIIKAGGKAVHSCQPEKGENAIFKMAEQLSTMGLTENRLYSLLKMIHKKLRDIYGKELGLYNDSEFYNGEFVHRNVFFTHTIKNRERLFEIMHQHQVSLRNGLP